MAGSGTRAIVAALVANTGIAGAKFVGFAVTGSGSMLAEGVHSVADASNQALLLLGGRRARKAPTPAHDFGYGRERYFWAFVVALVLFTLGSVYALYEGYQKVRHPHEIQSLEWAIGILLLGIVLETYSFRTAIVEANKDRGSIGWWQYIRRSKSPEIPVVLLEDLGALLGLVFALIAVSAAQVTGDPLWDGVGTLAIGVLLGIIAVVLAVEMKSLLIGESASPSLEAEISAIVLADAAAHHLIDIKTQYLAPEDLLVALKVHFHPDLLTDTIVTAINNIEAGIRSTIPHATHLFLEPDVTPEATDDGP